MKWIRNYISHFIIDVNTIHLSQTLPRDPSWDIIFWLEVTSLGIEDEISQNLKEFQFLFAESELYSAGNIVGPLWGEFIGHRWILHAKGQ